MKHQLLVIEGNIGSGKTTLAKRLAAQANARLVLEEFADNPFLPLFYQSPEKYAFPLELFFMAERYQQLKSQLPNQDLFQVNTITDYMFNKSLIFAKVTLSDEEFKLFNRLFAIIKPNLADPGLIVYLYSSIPQLLQNIQQRGREYEQSISGDYLLRLHRTYFDYFRQQKTLRILVIDVGGKNWIEDGAHFERLRALIDQSYPEGMNFREL